MEQCGSKLVEEAMEKDGGGAVVLIKDCVETNGAFLLHNIIKRSLSLPTSTVIFVSFAHPFSHYDRILRKLGCNLVVQRDNKRFIYLDMLSVECPGVFDMVTSLFFLSDFRKMATSSGFIELYGKIQGAVEANTLKGVDQNVTVLIDDISLMEVAANGSSNHVMDFIRYCHSLTTEFGCSLVLLHHGDVYSSTEMPSLSLQIEYLVDVILKAEPLATGLASDVHGQLTMTGKIFDGPDNRIRNFHFRVRENCVEYFYPGSRT